MQHFQNLSVNFMQKGLIWVLSPSEFTFKKNIIYRWRLLSVETVIGGDY